MTTPRHPSPLRRYLRHGMLPQLATFEAVLRLRSATRAAESMCIAQPTLSGHLRKLSEALGIPLFKTEGKHLVPADAALVLLQTTREIFAALERCEATLAKCRRGEPASGANMVLSPIIVVAGPSVEPAVRSAPGHESAASDSAPECESGSQRSGGAGAGRYSSESSERHLASQCVDLHRAADPRLRLRGQRIDVQ